MKSTFFIIVLLAALAALINHFAPTIFFDMQLMLGGSIAVFALLQFGWPGLLVGLAGLVITALRWGHPFELIIGSLFLVWLKIFLDRFNGGRAEQKNGRIVLAALVFWIVAGIPLEILLFKIRFGLEIMEAMVIAIKEASTGMINVTLGLLIYLMTGIARGHKSGATIPVRGAVFVVVILVISIPAITLSLISTRQLQAAAIEAYRLRLRQHAFNLVHHNHDNPELFSREERHYIIEHPDGSITSSRPGLQEELRAYYNKQTINRARTPGLDYYAPRANLPVMEDGMKAYWAVTYIHRDKDNDDQYQSITVYQAAPVLFKHLNHTLLLPFFSFMFGLFTTGVLISEALSVMVQRQFKRVLRDHDKNRLGASNIRELDELSEAINTRDARLAELNEALNETRQTAYELTENIPVGTYTMVQPADGGLAFFSFMSSRFLELTGLEAQEARSDPMKAFACVHPDDREDWVRKNIEVFEKKLPFREECRVIVKGEVRWIIAESRPRDLPDGSVVWEGVLSDITDRKKAEQALANANLSMRLAAQATNLGFWDYNVNTGLDVWDENMCRIHGLKPDEFDGDWKKFVHPDDYDEVMKETQRMLAGDAVFVMDYRIIRADGQIRHIREHGLVIRDEQGHALRAHGTMFDITDEVMAKQRQRDLEQAHRENLESKLKSSLAAAAIGHEINTPLSTLLLQTKQSLKKGSANPDELALIARESEHVLRIIEKMKALMRNVETEHHKVNLREIVESSLLQVKRPLMDQDIEVQVREKPAGQAFVVPGDDAQIQLALTNILRNAIEAIAENDMGRPREILIEMDQQDDGLRIAIGDSGPGWSGVELEELPLNTTKTDGTGIGLYIIRTTAQNHRARLAFNPSPLGGAEVSINFPVR